ncbi:hypothetical protein HYV10_03995 [Candidatus Dependentiae bacterium]|nr:hypothetical protein [Candidatus Dependentiae bacterium]
MQQAETSVKHTEFLDIPVVLLKIKKYSPLLFYKFLKNFEKKLSLDIKKIDLDQDLSLVQKDLQTTFLGQAFLYWFSDLSLISSKKKRSDFLNFIAVYQGPHKIIGCVELDEEVHLTHGKMIEFQDSYSSDQVLKLDFLYEGQKVEVVSYFLAKLYRKRKQYSLDQLCILLEYASLLGKNIDQFFERWLDEIVASEVSLYAVGQYFFEKNPKKFFELFNQIRYQYTNPFWTSFFSEQLFKAYWFVVHNGQIAIEQKQMTFGLPFSFIKNDWRLHKKSSLLLAHQKIYEIDLAIKSGAGERQLDLFLMRFFQGC